MNDVTDINSKRSKTNKIKKFVRENKDLILAGSVLSFGVVATSLLSAFVAQASVPAIYIYRDKDTGEIETAITMPDENEILPV